MFHCRIDWRARPYYSYRTRHPSQVRSPGQTGAWGALDEFNDMSSTSEQTDMGRRGRVGKLMLRAPPEGHPGHAVSVEFLENLSGGLRDTQKWVFECDRGNKRTPSTAKGRPRASKKVGCPVEWHVYRLKDGRWYLTQIGEHNHSRDVDRFTCLSQHARDAIQFLARQRHTAFDICRILRGPDNAHLLGTFPGLTLDQLSVVTQAKVEQELNRIRRQQLSHPEEREAVKQDTDKTIKVLNTNRSKRRKQDSSSVDQTPRR